MSGLLQVHKQSVTGEWQLKHSPCIDVLVAVKPDLHELLADIRYDKIAHVRKAVCRALEELAVLPDPKHGDVGPRVFSQTSHSPEFDTPTNTQPKSSLRAGVQLDSEPGNRHQPRSSQFTWTVTGVQTDEQTEQQQQHRIKVLPMLPVAAGLLLQQAHEQPSQHEHNIGLSPAKQHAVDLRRTIGPSQQTPGQLVDARLAQEEHCSSRAPDLQASATEQQAGTPEKSGGLWCV